MWGAARYVERPMECTKYTDYVDENPDTFMFPSQTFLNPSCVVVVSPKTVEEFDAFTGREQALSVALFSHRDDPETKPLFEFLAGLANPITKFVFVDVGQVPALGAKYGIKGPTIFKIYKGHALRQLSRPFTPERLKAFAQPKSTIRWRQPEIR